MVGWVGCQLWCTSCRLIINDGTLNRACSSRHLALYSMWGSWGSGHGGGCMLQRASCMLLKQLLPLLWTLAGCSISQVAMLMHGRYRSCYCCC